MNKWSGLENLTQLELKRQRDAGTATSAKSPLQCTPEKGLVTRGKCHGHCTCHWTGQLGWNLPD